MGTNQNDVSNVVLAQGKYETARKNLLLMLILTVVNVILLFVGSDVMMLFSATVPYLAAVFGVAWAGTIISIVCFAIAILSLIAYLVCWYMSKKHHGWMIFALVLFILDTLAMIGMYLMLGEVSGILDVVIHVWVLYYLIIGVKYGKQLKEMSMSAPAGYGSGVQNTYEAARYETNHEEIPYYEAVDTPALRRADSEEKFRVLLEADAQGHHVCYRRVKRVNELVIDGYVYDDVEMLVEPAHTLNARIDGHVFQVGYDGVSKSYLRVDGESVASKRRFW